MITAPPGWYPQPDGRRRYWDGKDWTESTAPGTGVVAREAQATEPNRYAASRVPREQIAHDLAIAYINNRYGAKVEGEFSVSADQDWSGDSPRLSDVNGSGEVRTKTLPRVSKIRVEEVVVKTGGRTLFGLGPERTRTDRVESGEFEVDHVFLNMIRDYYEAYGRFIELLAK